jgi:hypothetical protein
MASFLNDLLSFLEIAGVSLQSQRPAPSLFDFLRKGPRCSLVLNIGESNISPATRKLANYFGTQAS